MNIVMNRKHIAQNVSVDTFSFFLKNKEIAPN